MEKISIQALPFEILAKIFEHVDVDQLRILARVCSFWNHASNAEYLWRDRCLKKWAKWAPLPSDNWKKVYENRIRKEQKTLKSLYNMCYITRQEDLEQKILDDSVEIEEFISHLVQEDKSLNLTSLFFANFMIDRLRQKRICESWKEFLSSDAVDQRLEEGAVLLCQWDRPAVQLDQINFQLDQIANRVFEEIRKTSQNSQMDSLNALNKVLFREMNFRGNETDYYSAENSFIDCVLDRRLGIPISLAVVYACVARRVGIRIDLIGFPGHLMVRHVSSSGSEIFIDVFARGSFHNRDQLISRFGENLPAEIFEPLTTLRIFSRMLSNLSTVFQNENFRLYGIMNQMIAMNENDHRVYAQRAYYHMRYLFRPKRAIQDASKALASPALVEPELRRLEESFNAVIRIPPSISAEIRFRIGDVVRDMNRTRETFNELGIVCGRTLAVYEIIFDHGPSSFPINTREIDLVLNLASPIPGMNTVGKYFEEFKDGRYIPNEYIKRRFPDG